jgi:hypothetical protein
MKDRKFQKDLENKDIIPMQNFIVEAGVWWLTPVILVIQETDIRSIKHSSKPSQTNGS